MARVLPEWPDTKPEYRRQRSYDWERWFDGQVWELGVEDWGGDTAAFRNAAWRYAWRCGGRVRVKRRNSGTMVVQYLEGKIDAGND